MIDEEKIRLIHCTNQLYEILGKIEALNVRLTGTRLMSGQLKLETTQQLRKIINVMHMNLHDIKQIALPGMEAEENGKVD